MTPHVRSFSAVLDQVDRVEEGDRDRLRTLALEAFDALDREEGRRRRERGRFASTSDSVEAGLTRLRSARSSAQLLDGLCEEAARSCGLRRVLLSRVADGVWHPWMVHPSPALGGFTAIDTEPVRLTAAPIEAEALASRQAALVSDVEADTRVHAALTRDLGTTSYVVAPLTPGGRAVGLLHGDAGRGGRRLDETDRDVLWAFAEGAGRVYERLVLQERLVAQRTTVRETFSVVDRAMTRFAQAEIELVRREIDATAEEASARPAALDGGDSAIDALLTEREREVLAMMLNGHTNQAIAERLVIREGTVKSHVKHILRKTGAANRTEVISRYAAARG